MRQPECGTNTPYLIDFIEICLASKLLNHEEIRKLYEEDGLSSTQIARRFGVSRAAILTRLHGLGIRDQSGTKRAVNPKNYRMRVPPYGYSIRDGKLVPNKVELKICRLIVELVQRHGMKQNAVARELSKRGYKNRAGNKNWNSKTVFNIFKRWKDKL